MSPFLVPVLACAALLAPFAGFVPDDLYIYLQFARNLVERGEIAFNPGEPVNAVTSPLWLLWLAAGRALGLDALRVAQAGSAAGALLAVAGVVALVAWTAGRRDLALAAGLVFATDPWVLRWGLSGMEGTPSAAVVVWCFALRARSAGPPSTAGARAPAAVDSPPAAGVRARAGSFSPAVGSAALLALAPLLRPECAVLVAIVLAWDLFAAWRTGRFGPLAVETAAVALVPGSWAFYAWSAFGTVVPATAVAKGSLGSAFLDAGEALARVVKVLLVGQAVPLAILGAAAVAWIARRPRAAPAGPAAVWAPAALFGAGLVALYAVRNVSVYTRYLLVLSPLVAAGGLAASGRLLSGSARRRARLLYGAVAAGVAMNLAVVAIRVLPSTRAYAEHMETVNVALGRLLAETAPEDAVVATPNIGAIGYVSGRRILDTNGLITPDLVPFKREGRIADYLRAHPPDYYVEIHADPDHAERNPPGLRLRPLWKAPFAHMFVGRPEPLWYALYAVDGVLKGS